MAKWNSEIIRKLRKKKSIDLNDPVARAWIVGELSNYSTRNRAQVQTAVQAYVSNRKDAVIDTEKERENLAVLITRMGVQRRQRAPLARGVSKAAGMMKKRRYNFQESKGRGTRKFDGVWRGHRIADANTKFDAERLAKFMRKELAGYQKGRRKSKVRVIPYQAGKKTHYSVYSDTPVTVAHSGYVKSLRKHAKKDPHAARILSRVVGGDYKPSLYAQKGVPILLTKKRLPELGLRMRVY